MSLRSWTGLVVSIRKYKSNSLDQNFLSVCTMNKNLLFQHCSSAAPTVVWCNITVIKTNLPVSPAHAQPYTWMCCYLKEAKKVWCRTGNQSYELLYLSPIVLQGNSGIPWPQWTHIFPNSDWNTIISFNQKGSLARVHNTFDCLVLLKH